MSSCGEGLVLSADGKGCVDKNECLYFPCRNGGSCVNREPGYRCHCPEGFWGENCELVQEGRTLKLSMGALAAILVCLLIIMSEQYSKWIGESVACVLCIDFSCTSSIIRLKISHKIYTHLLSSPFLV